MSDKGEEDFPETGWGMPFRIFFNEPVSVENHAKNGRSTRTFISEGRWQGVKNALSEGDYVFIQFGHNDESKKKVDRYTAPTEYQKNLSMFVDHIRAAKATPILLSPVSRRHFIANTAQQTHTEYSLLVADIAKKKKALFIDADAMSRSLYQSFGPEWSRYLFLQLAKNEHPNYPDGIEDNTHFNELGARLIAQLILKEAIRIDPSIQSLTKKMNTHKH